MTKDAEAIAREHCAWARENGWTPIQVIESVGLATHPFKLYTWDNARWAVERAVAQQRVGPVEDAPPCPSAGDVPPDDDAAKAKARRARPRSRKRGNDLKESDRSRRADTKGSEKHKSKVQAFKDEKHRRLLAAHRARKIAKAPLPEGKTRDDMIAEFLATRGATKLPPGKAWGVGEYDDHAIFGG